LTGIEEAIRELKAKDNILPKLMASPSSGERGGGGLKGRVRWREGGFGGARIIAAGPALLLLIFSSPRTAVVSAAPSNNRLQPLTTTNPPQTHHSTHSHQHQPIQPTTTNRQPTNPPTNPPGYDALFEAEIAKYSKLSDAAAASAARNDAALAGIARDSQVGTSELHSAGCDHCGCCDRGCC
jgi:hypothetical protein